jgi:NarL family two-component system response regulator YdfI
VILTRIALVDTHIAAAESTALVLNQQARFTARPYSNFTNLSQSLDTFKPHIVIIKIYPETAVSALDACRSVAMPPHRRTILLAPCSFMESSRFYLEAIEAGACGLFPSEMLGLSELTTLIREIHSGKTLLDQARLRNALTEQLDVEADKHSKSFKTAALTPREDRVVGLLLDGASTRAIADDLRISEHTVRTHLSNIFRKLGVQTRAQAIALLVRRQQERDAYEPPDLAIINEVI